MLLLLFSYFNIHYIFKMIRIFLLFFFSFLILVFVAQAQETAFGNQTIDELLRRKSLIYSNDENTGWMLRTASASIEPLFYKIDSASLKKKFIKNSLIGFVGGCFANVGFLLSIGSIPGYFAFAPALIYPSHFKSFNISVPI